MLPILKNQPSQDKGKTEFQHCVTLRVVIVAFFFLQLVVVRLNVGGQVRDNELLDTLILRPAAPFSQNTKALIGRQIVERTFNESYSDLVQFCNKTDSHMIEFTECVKKFHALTKVQTLPYAEKWPWWFQTMMRDASLLKSGLAGGWHILQFKDPKLQICVIEKAGTKQFRDFHCKAINKTHEKTLFNCYQEQGPHLRNSDKSVFLRDPLDRFLSGFIDKCVIRRNVEPHCEPLDVFANSNTTLVKDFYTNKKKLFEAYVDAMPLTWNMHFFPQSLYCGGLYNDIKNHSFIGSMGSSMYQDLDRFSRQYPSLEPWLDEVFNLKDTSQKANAGVETRAATRVLDFYTPHTVRRVLEYFSIDYIMLNLTIPLWAEQMLAEAESKSSSATDGSDSSGGKKPALVLL